MSDPALMADAAHARLKAAFSPDTPEEIRARLIDAVLAVLNGEDDD